ncbi:hypothetical protein HaLaN_00481 [Haematococcus lacustris]|uniref:Uncharacterized protein n=1 Tax=Haematococcus lacustris TaxID=44745 RepID=A0A699Y9D2_HAELA|nr:hypothetical protein HaLaN_00481 [Haematococcus lacustris]
MTKGVVCLCVGLALCLVPYLVTKSDATDSLGKWCGAQSARQNARRLRFLALTAALSSVASSSQAVQGTSSLQDQDSDHCTLPAAASQAGDRKEACWPQQGSMEHMDGAVLRLVRALIAVGVGGIGVLTSFA